MTAKHFEIVLPFVCVIVVAYRETFSRSINLFGRANHPVLEELASQQVDREKTQENMKAFAAVPGNLIDCDNGAYDKAYFTAQVAKGTLTTLDLYNYAGYVLDGKLLRFCVASDSTIGEKVN